MQDSTDDRISFGRSDTAIGEGLQLAVARHRAGRLDEARRIYTEILKAQPQHPEANHQLGLLEVQAGHPATAVEYLKAALAVNPKQAQYWLGYIDALSLAGRTDEASEVLARGVLAGLRGPAVGDRVARLAANGTTGEPRPGELASVVALFQQGRFSDMAILAELLTRRAPNHAFGWKALGLALEREGRGDEALAALREAVRLLPNDVEAISNLGESLRKSGAWLEAETWLRKATKIGPDHAGAHNNLGSVLKDLGRLGEALSCFQQAIACDNMLAAAHSNLGAILTELGREVEGENQLRQALIIAPGLADAHCNLGNLLQGQGHVREAELSLRRALQLKPDFAMACCNLGKVLQDQGQLNEAEVMMRRAVELEPARAQFHSNLGNILQDRGLLVETAARVRQAVDIDPGNFAVRSNLIFSLHYDGQADSVSCLEEACKFGSMASAVAKPYRQWRAARKPDRLRVGLVSGDFFRHPVGYFLESLLLHLDDSRVELIAYPTRLRDDDLTTRLRRSLHAWRPLAGLPDEAAAASIHEDGIHLLLDLSGHTAHNRLPVFAWRPAPIQASWLGYFATTGLTEIDYLLADSVCVPPDHFNQFSEKVWYLPDTRLCFTPPDLDASIARRGNRPIVFGSYQTLAKAGNNVFAAWASILEAVPDATLRWQTRQFGDSEVASATLGKFMRYGIARERVSLHGSMPRDAYLRSYSEVDLLLDTFPFPGGTTTCEALWMGVPTITLAGDRLISRQGASLMAAAGLPDWIATSEAEYMAKAIAFSNDLSRLEALRHVLRKQVLQSPLFDAGRFARNFEETLWGMWGTRTGA